MPKAGTHTVKGSGSLTKYDPIKDTTGNKPTNTHRGAPRGVTSALREGTSIKAGSKSGGGTPKGTPALPRRDYS